jgi:thiosulfate/3-mercaptopyruvate sulfurtransferase
MIYRTLISAEQLRAALPQGDVALFDCGFELADPEAGWNAYRAGHIPQARYLHLEEDLSGAPTGGNGRHPLPDPERLAARLRKAGVRRGQQVVAYDASGGAFAARLWWLLRWIGHDAVAVLDGGRQAWLAAGGSLEAGEGDNPGTGDFAASLPDERQVVDADLVLGNIKTGKCLVIDARAPERFRGDPNPLDPVAGHIPGARNRCFRDNLDATGGFKPGSQLAAEFAQVLGNFSPNEIIHQCGSGVTACHNALAMELAGLGGAALYPGSWSEWISDPARPVATDTGCAN